MNACTGNSLILLLCLPSIEMEETFHFVMKESPQSSLYGFTQGYIYIYLHMLTKGQIINLNRKNVEIIEKKNPERLSFRIW